MGWAKTITREKPHRCRRPRIKRSYGDGSQWKCGTCSQLWELHRRERHTHWGRYGDFCDHCGPTRPYQIHGEWYGGLMKEPPNFPATKGQRP